MSAAMSEGRGRGYRSLQLPRCTALPPVSLVHSHLLLNTAFLLPSRCTPVASTHHCMGFLLFVHRTLLLPISLFRALFDQSGSGSAIAGF